MGDVSILRCPNGHGLGIIKRNQAGRAYLMLYRHAVDLMATNPEQVDVLALVSWATDIRCDLCEATKVWLPDREEVRRYLRSKAGNASRITKKRGTDKVSEV